ncbi:MAG: phosphoribosylaminoimidazolesuccinocarboxamide synthase, partial [Gammaproteobacteria bacterium]
MTALYQSDLSGLELINRGKVRDIYAVDDEHLLIVTTDRLSAFDVILPQPIPGKGEVLTRVSNFWFKRTEPLVPNQLTDIPLEAVVTDAKERKMLGDRAIVVRRLQPLPVEAIVRGYIIGSGWKDYQKTGQVCGIPLPQGLQLADRLPEPIFTPSTKAEQGEH